MVALWVQGGIAITPDVAAVAIVLVVVLLVSGRMRPSSWLPLLVLLLAYELMRGLADDAGFPLHMEDLIVAERLLALGALPTQILQDTFHNGSGIEPVGLIATTVYMLHFAVPIGAALVLWAWRRPHFHDFMAGLILLSLAAFMTFVVFPAAPPWFAAERGLLNGPDGMPVVVYMKPLVFDAVAAGMGFDGELVYNSVFYGLGPNHVAAWPSLHVAYPFIAFLFLRRAFGRVAWSAFGYTLVVAFSVVYTGDHWVIDAIAGMAYAFVAYYAIAHTPEPVRVWLDRATAGVGRRTVVGETS
jgi:hypothetical protein